MNRNSTYRLAVFCLAMAILSFFVAVLPLTASIVGLAIALFLALVGVVLLIVSLFALWETAQVLFGFLGDFLPLLGVWGYYSVMYISPIAASVGIVFAVAGALLAYRFKTKTKRDLASGALVPPVLPRPTPGKTLTKRERKNIRWNANKLRIRTGTPQFTACIVFGALCVLVLLLVLLPPVRTVLLEVFSK